MLLQGLAAMAPLTGSDALHYHFPAARLYIAEGFHPNFFFVHSFLASDMARFLLPVFPLH